MIEVRAATEPESQSWLDGWRERLRQWFSDFSPEPDWVQHRVEAYLTRWSNAAQRHVFTLTEGGQPVGQLALSVLTDPPSVMLDDLWVQPQFRRRGYGRAAMSWAQQWAPQHATRLMVIGRGGDPAQEALFGHLETGALKMVKPLPPNGVESAAGIGRMMRPEEFEPWRAAQERGYVEHAVGSGLASRAEAQAKASQQFDELLPEGLATENHTFLCVEADGAVVATNWLAHHYAPATSFVLAVEVQAAHQGKGYGRLAMQLGEQAALAAGDSQVALNVFGQNTPAIGLYEAMGYRTLEKIRSVKFGS
jgi:GNAT superfamily N-acetyltransferase